MTDQPIRILVIGNRRDFEQFCQVQRISPHSGQVKHVHNWYSLRGYRRDRTLVILLPSWLDLRDWQAISDVIRARGLVTREFDPWKAVQS